MPDKMPEARAFFSLTMYDLNNNLIKNSKNYCITSLNPTYEMEPDGSLILYIQAENPDSDKESNWLQAPKHEGFFMVFRAYLPGKDIINQKSLY